MFTNDVKSPNALVNFMTKLAASYMKITLPSLISLCKKIDGMINWMRQIITLQNCEKKEYLLILQFTFNQNVAFIQK